MVHLVLRLIDVQQFTYANLGRSLQVTQDRGCMVDGKVQGEGAVANLRVRAVDDGVIDVALVIGAVRLGPIVKITGLLVLHWRDKGLAQGEMPRHLNSASVGGNRIGDVGTRVVAVGAMMVDEIASGHLALVDWIGGINGYLNRVG